jgi:hypothetical protein
MTEQDPIPAMAPKVPEPGVVAVSARTGEPERPWPIWLALVLGFYAVGIMGVSTLVVYYDAVQQFADASWLMSRWETEPGSLARVLLAVAVTAAALAVAVPAAITGYYAWAGFSWTRWSGLVTALFSGLCLLLNPLAWAAIPLLVAQAIMVWLPQSVRYFDDWRVRRHPAPELSEPVTAVAYGPLPRYR